MTNGYAGVLRFITALAVTLPLVPGPSWAEGSPADLTGVAQKSAELYAQGDLDGAVRLLRGAIGEQPEDPQLHFMLANALFRQHEWLGAVRHYGEASRLRPYHPDTYLGLGYACYQAGRIDEAIAAWRTAMHQSPNDALTHLSLAVGLSARGLIAEAHYHITWALDLDPGWRQRISIDVRWTREMVRVVDGLLDQVKKENTDSRVGG